MTCQIRVIKPTPLPESPPPQSSRILVSAGMQIIIPSGSGICLSRADYKIVWNMDDITRDPNLDTHCSRRRIYCIFYCRTQKLAGKSCHQILQVYPDHNNKLMRSKSFLIVDSDSRIQIIHNFLSPFFIYFS